MKPKNRKERRNSFLKFLGMFIVTVSMILVAMYFNFKVPEKENVLLRAEAEIVREGTKFQRGFFNDMQIVKGMLDSLEIPGQNISYQNSLISRNLADLQKKIPTKDSTYRYDMHANIVQLFVELQTAKGRLMELQDAENTITKYKAALETCEEDIKGVRRELSIERQ